VETLLALAERILAHRAEVGEECLRVHKPGCDCTYPGKAEAHACLEMTASGPVRETRCMWNAGAGEDWEATLAAAWEAALVAAAAHLHLGKDALHAIVTERFSPRLRACRLKDIPNGFLALASASPAPLYAVQHYLNRALLHTRRRAAAAGLADGAITDRALAVAVLPYAALVKACKATRGLIPAGSSPLHDALQIRDLDPAPISLPIAIHFHVRAMVAAYSGSLMLKTVRDLQNGAMAQTGAGAESASEAMEAHVLLSVTKIRGSDGDVWELSLPGGKRKLGESTWMGMVRESWEECLISGFYVGLCEADPENDHPYRKDPVNQLFIRVVDPHNPLTRAGRDDLALLEKDELCEEEIKLLQTLSELTPPPWDGDIPADELAVVLAQTDVN
jgi:8-oxo-dGTP pyrophosphatase MutT (NUDIX family)